MIHLTLNNGVTQMRRIDALDTGVRGGPDPDEPRDFFDTPIEEV